MEFLILGLKSPNSDMPAPQILKFTYTTTANKILEFMVRDK